MEYIFGDYLDSNKQEELLNSATCDEEYRRYRAGIVINNCVTKFRTWATNDDAKKRVLEAIKNGKLYFSTALGYNDPYDTLMYYERDALLSHIVNEIDTHMDEYVQSLKQKNFSTGCMAEYILKAANEKKLKTDFISDVEQKISKMKSSIHDNIKGICFSKNTLSVLMWAHYAKDHTGIALLYDIKELQSADCFDLEGNLLPEQFELKPIRYAEQRPDATKFVNDYLLRRATFENFPVVDNLNIGTILDEPDYKIVKDIVLTKDIAWSYEKEVRLIPRDLNFEGKSDIGFLKIKPKAIILGAKISESDRDEILKILKGNKDIIPYEAWLNDSQPGYQIVFQEIRP